MCPPAKINGVWPFNDAWLRTSLEEARRQAPRNVASILDSAREFGIRDAQARRDPDSPLVFHRDDIPVRRAIQQADATLWYLPPYSPDLNPSERCFAKLKAIVRAARCRSIDRLWPFLGECLQRFSPAECRN